MVYHYSDCSGHACYVIPRTFMADVLGNTCDEVMGCGHHIISRHNATLHNRSNIFILYI